MELLHRMFEMTDALGREPECEDIDRVLEQRRGIIAEIESTQGELENAGWLKTVRGDSQLEHLKKEINGLVSSIADADHRLETCLSGRMEELRREMRGLYSTSRAAYAYAANNRTATR